MVEQFILVDRNSIQVHNTFLINDQMDIAIYF